MSVPSSDPPPLAPLTILVGRTREDRRGALAQVAGLDAFQRPEFLYLTAARRKADVVSAAFWNQPDKPPTFLPTVTPFGAFRDELADRWGAGRALLDPVARDLLAGQVFRSIKPRLRVWGGLEDGPDLRVALADFAEAWALGFSGRDVPPVGQEPYALRFPGEPEPAWGPLFATTRAVGPALREDAWRFLSAWRAALARSPAWTDRAGHARGLLGPLLDGAAPLLASLRRWRRLIVDDLLWLPPLDLAILRALVTAWRRAVPDGSVHLCLEAPLDGDPERARRWLSADLPDAPGDRISKDLRASWARFGDERIEVADSAPQHADLADLLARDGVLPAHVESTVGAVRARSYPSARAELRAVARALKTELLGGASPESLFVSFPDLERYAPLVRDVFSGYGIPFVIERGEPLLHSPPCSAARQLLGLTLDVTPEAMRSLLASGWIRAWFPVDPERADALARQVEPLLGHWSEPVKAEVAQRIEDRVVLMPTMTRLHRAIVEAGAGGAAPLDWLRGILPTLLRGADDTLRRYSTERADAERVERTRRGVVSDVAGLMLEALAIDRLLAALGPLRAASPSDVAARFLDLLETLGIRPSGTSPELDRVRRDARIANDAAIETLRELVQGVARSLHGVDLASPGDAHGRPLAVFRDALEDAVRRTTYKAGGPTAGVQVVGLRDLQGTDVPWLWVAGLVDSSFPRSPAPSFLLPSLEPPLVPTLDRSDEDRAVFASLLRSVGHGARLGTPLVLSWPRTEAGRDVVPSAVVQDLLALRIQDSEDSLGDWWRGCQAVDEDALPALLSRDELLTRPGLCDALPAPTADDPEAATLLSAADRRSLSRWDEVVAARTDDTGFGAWDGVLAMDRPWRQTAVQWLGDALRVERRERKRDRLELPATWLEAWARCPIRFFFERVLDVDEPKPFAAQPGADESGTLQHVVLERLLAERIQGRKAGRLRSSALHGLGPAELEALSRRMGQIADEVLTERLGHRTGPWVDRLRRDLTAGLTPDDAAWRGPLARFVAEESRGAFLDAEPAYVEKPFAHLSPSNAAWRLRPPKERGAAFRAGTGDLDVQVRGTIDRVDLPPPRGGRLARGDGGLRLVVYDYKTGRTPRVADVDEGRQLQPVLYPAAIDVPWYGRGMVSGYWELREEPGRQRRRLAVSNKLWNYLRTQRSLTRPIGFRRTTKATTMTAWRAWLMRVDWYGQLIGSGVFPPTLNRPQVAGCRHCPFRRAGRREPGRTERILNPPAPSDGRVAPVFWPHPLSVAAELEAMYGARGDLVDTEPDEDPAPEPATAWTSAPSQVRPTTPVTAPVTDEFDDLFGEDLF